MVRLCGETGSDWDCVCGRSLCQSLVETAVEVCLSLSLSLSAWTDLTDCERGLDTAL